MELSRIENPIEYLNEGEDGFENNIQVLEDDDRNEFDNEQDIEAGQMEFLALVINLIAQLDIQLKIIAAYLTFVQFCQDLQQFEKYLQLNQEFFC
jgi:hypothetical protein